MRDTKLPDFSERLAAQAEARKALLEKFKPKPTVKAVEAEGLFETREQKKAIPGYGHSLHKSRDPRVDRLFAVAKEAGTNLRFVEIAEAIEAVIPAIVGKELRLNVSAAIPAVLLGTNFPLRALRGVPILARCAGVIAHLAEEAVNPSGFALSYQATRELVYEGPEVKK